MGPETIDEIRNRYDGELPEYSQMWENYFNTFVRKVNTLTTPDNIITLKIETLEECGFEIGYEIKQRVIEGTEEEPEYEEYEAYSVHPKGESVLNPKEYSDMRPEELADMVDQCFTEEIIDFQAWYIITYFNPELVAYITGLNVFRELMLESSVRIQIKKDEQETSRENKLRVKTNNWIQGSGELLDRINLLRSKLFANGRNLENKTISGRKKRIANSQFIDRIKKERNVD